MSFHGYQHGPMLINTLATGYPANVIVESVLKPLSVRVSWQAVEDADRYTVTFRKETDRYQKGYCKYEFHTAIVSVDATNASVAVGRKVKRHETTMLRAYTTYAITVVAENNQTGTSNSSYPISFTTPQTSK